MQYGDGWSRWKFDLAALPDRLPDAIAAAAKLGYEDERTGHKDRRGPDIARAICRTWREYHQRAFRAAYSVARWDMRTRE